MFEDTSTNQDGAASGVQSEVGTTATTQDDDVSLLNSDSDESLEHTEEENDEIEVDGKKFALPKSAAEKLKSERMMNADYTQKTQGLASERQQFATEREQFQQQQQQHNTFIADIAKVVAIDDQIAQYNALPMDEIIRSDPQYAMQLQEQMRQLMGKRSAAVQQVTQKQQQSALYEQQETAKQLQQAGDYLTREIKGFSKERSDQLLAYGVTRGMDGNALSRMVIKSPEIGVMIHKAELYDALVKKQAPKPPAPAPGAKPAPQVGSSAKVKKDPSEMSASEFRAYRLRVKSKR